MKIRSDFVANSSSTSFIITNKTSETKTLLDFAEENIYLLEEYNRQYGGIYGDQCYNIGKDDFLNSIDDTTLLPGKNYVIFGDEDGTVVGKVYDYILRDGGESENFKWKYKESLR